MKIAIASSDGVKIDEHFGQARRFLIFTLHPDGAMFMEERPVTPYSDGEKSHPFNEDRFAQCATALQGCHRLYCAQIGERPAAELKKIGVEPIMTTGMITDLRLSD